MIDELRSPLSRTTWAYGYEILPPLRQDRLRTVEAMLDEEHSNARRSARTWQGRFVLDEQVTHILVVSDSADQTLEVNRRLEAELKRLDVKFSTTPPVLVTDSGRHPS
jgi:hypothetical protein